MNIQKLLPTRPVSQNVHCKWSSTCPCAIPPYRVSSTLIALLQWVRCHRHWFEFRQKQWSNGKILIIQIQWLKSKKNMTTTSLKQSRTHRSNSPPLETSKVSRMSSTMLAGSRWLARSTGLQREHYNISCPGALIGLRHGGD